MLPSTTPKPKLLRRSGQDVPVATPEAIASATPSSATSSSKKKGKKTPPKGFTTPTTGPVSSGKKGSRSTSERKETVHPNTKAVTRLFKEVVSCVERWQVEEEEAHKVIGSLASFQSRLPLLEKAAMVPKMLGALSTVYDPEDAMMPNLIVKHLAEVRRLVSHLGDNSRAELRKAVDDMLKAVEDARTLVERRPLTPWDPSRKQGSNPLSPCEMITWLDQTATMFSDELWRKEVIIDNLITAVYYTEDDKKTATMVNSASRLWRDNAEESFVDAAFLESVTCTAEFVL